MSASRLALAHVAGNRFCSVPPHEMMRTVSDLLKAENIHEVRYSSLLEALTVQHSNSM